jgi:type I restriction enzyme S subunit
LVSLLDALASAEEFVDGDWVESKDQDPEGDVRLLQLADVGDGEYIDKSDRFLTSAKARALRCTYLKPGDVMVARMPDPLGRACIFPGDAKVAVTVVDVCIIRPNAREHDARWLMQCLNAPDCRNQIAGYATGTTRSRISRGNLGKIKIPLPPLAEQRRIAEVLDRAEALRAKRRAALAQLDSLTQSLFLDLFGDPATNPKGWPKKSLGEIAREKPNNGIFRKNPEYVQDGKGGLPVVWLEEIFRGDSIDTKDSRRVIPAGSEVEKYGLKTGDILFCRSSLKLDGIAFNNVYLGKDDEALFECHVIRISPDLKIISPVFLNSLLRLPQMRAIAKSKSKTATMTTIDQQSLCSIELPLPPVKLQHEFAGRIRAVEKLKVAHRASLAELDALFATLQNRAFKGEL